VLFISHDLALETAANRIGVLYGGVLMEAVLRPGASAGRASPPRRC
jgi:ABC-type dipeptide/oligopeptide/nickel transport system ATPase component